MMKKKNNRWTL